MQYCVCLSGVAPPLPKNKELKECGAGIKTAISLGKKGMVLVNDWGRRNSGTGRIEPV